MNFFPFDLVIFVRKLFTLFSNVPFAKPDPELTRRCRVDAVGSGQDPPRADEGATARYPFAEEALLDYGGLPRMFAEACVVASNDSRLGIEKNFSALGVRSNAKVGIDSVHLVAVYTARPDEPPIAEVHGLLAGNGTR